MKRILVTLSLLGFAMAGFCQNNSSESLETQHSRRLHERAPLQTRDQHARSAGKPVTRTGIAVQLARTDRRLQLINPAAPPEYGSGERNVVRDPVSGKVSGLKIFAVEF